MNFDLTEDQRAFQDTARAFAETHLRPKAAEWDETGHFAIDEMRKAAELGFAAIYIKGDVGGSELSRLDAAIIVVGLHRDGRLSVDPQHVGVDDRPLRVGCAAPPFPSQNDHDGAHRELLPDRT